jgi:adenosylcobinamide-GDP ribazoletransferase
MLKPFWVALQFLTRLPAPQQDDFSPELMGRSVLFYPLVGLVVGLCLVLVAWLTNAVDSNISAALVLATWVAITGALHIDGLADTADAWVGGHESRERTLEIMKDPYCGPMAVAAVVVILLIKFAAISVLLEKGQWAVLFIAPVIGRAAIIALFRWTSYVREQGLGALPYNYLPHSKVPLVLMSCAVFALLVLGWDAVTALIVIAAVFYLLRAKMMQRLGGTTGDTAGAMIEILEVVFLLAIALK